ncbi:GAF domain-containing protein [Nocardioides sp. zg-579]|uniref:GAF domain-containing protein n=1 Tax=Nocardioides marmotae TaxID=2663857 RepID=A0A6I3J4F8_9ACTN|nr:ATP-binding protein [Nocardioides marmotae]MCR6030338.1 GAF domain-containing protein [Gordonia jinghuaiqii]MTB93972.1 GAF domain-containing protein [Nocardioides marmotae]QKE00286.1 GAF domain-containing protein [Nocardioides marmotae]
MPMLDPFLRDAHDVDQVVRAVLAVVAGGPAVVRAALALSEGGGRRLRFVDSAAAVGQDDLDWSHIDAYDDVPLTTVVRTGEVVHGGLDDFGGRYASFLQGQGERGVAAVAALPLPGTGSPIGGLLVYLSDPAALDERRIATFRSIARRASDAVRRVRLASGRRGSDAVPQEPVVPEGALTTSVLLESSPRATGAARRFLREHLRAWAVDDEAVDDAQLCLSELVTNAVVHAGTASELRVVLDAGVLTVTVRDLGGLGKPTAAGEPHPSEDPDPLRVYGRGLQLVDALSTRWGSERDVTGTTVWFALELADAPATDGDPVAAG